MPVFNTATKVLILNGEKSIESDVFALALMRYIDLKIRKHKLLLRAWEHKSAK